LVLPWRCAQTVQRRHCFSDGAYYCCEVEEVLTRMAHELARPGENATDFRTSRGPASRDEWAPLLCLETEQPSPHAELPVADPHSDCARRSFPGQRSARRGRPLQGGWERSKFGGAVRSKTRPKVCHFVPLFATP
jgi:hypothetical protein